MALSLGGGGRRRRSCRAARRGNGRAGYRHFHVHYYQIPHQVQVWAFSPPRPRLWPRFLLLPYYLLILPVLFLVMLAFLVCFGWLTLFYLASSLWCRSVDRAGDANGFAGEDEREERPMKLVTEHADAGHSGLSDVHVEGKEIKEVEDGFSEESRYISRRMASTGTCIHDGEEKIVKEVTMLERNFEGSKAFAALDGSTEKYDQLVMGIPIDCFLKELNNTKEFSTSISDTTKFLDVLSIGEVFDANTKEISVFTSTAILKFSHNRDTAEIVPDGSGTDFLIPELTSSDDSNPRGHGDECTEIRKEQSPGELSVNDVSKSLPDDVTDEWQAQILVIEHNHKQPEATSSEEYRKQIVGIPDKFHDSVCAAMDGLLQDSVSENISENAAASNTSSHQTNSDKDIEIQEDLIQNKRVESSASASVVCDFADNHWRENFPEETSVVETVQNKDEDVDNDASMIAACSEVPSTVVELVWSS